MESNQKYSYKNGQLQGSSFWLTLVGMHMQAYLFE